MKRHFGFLVGMPTGVYHLLNGAASPARLGLSKATRARVPVQGLDGVRRVAESDQPERDSQRAWRVGTLSKKPLLVESHKAVFGCGVKSHVGGILRGSQSP